MENHFAQSSQHDAAVAEGGMVGVLAWWNCQRRQWRTARARRQAYREIALLPESLQNDLTTRHQEV